MFYITLAVDVTPHHHDVVWDLRSGRPDGFNIRVKTGRAPSYPSATYQAAIAIDKHLKETGS